jgi:hypothetical protein
LRPARHDRFNTHAQNIALFRAVNGDRSILRIDERELQLLCGPVVDGRNRAVESVERLGSDDVAWSNRKDRSRVGSIDVLIGALFGLRQMMRLADAAGRNPEPYRRRKPTLTFVLRLPLERSDLIEKTGRLSNVRALGFFTYKAETAWRAKFHW